MLHENLRKARVNKGMSQEQLALQLNVVRQTVSKWEKGTSVPDAETLVQLSEVLEIPVNKLLDEPSQPEPAELTDVAKQLARLNELTALKMQRDRELFNKLKEAAIIIVILLVLASILPHWNDVWHRFGQNLYHLFNPGS